MAKVKKDNIEVTEDDNTMETVELSEAYAGYGCIVTNTGCIEFVDGKATVTASFAQKLQEGGYVK